MPILKPPKRREIQELSPPREILTLDNKKAKIKQGLEVGYLERDDSGGATIKFKNVDLLMEITPHVTSDNRISMNDVVEYFNNVPVISTNEAKTELLVTDKDTVVIGGVVKTTNKTEDHGLPFLTGIPVIGVLFGKETPGG